MNDLRTGLVGLVSAALLVALMESSVHAQGACDGGFTNVPFGQEFRTLLAQGTTLWITTTRGGLVEWDTTTGQHRFYTQGAHCLPSNLVHDVAVDGAGNVWVGTDRGIARKPAGSPFDTAWEAMPLPPVVLDPTPTVESIEAAPDGTIWAGTLENALFQYRDGAWRHVDPDLSGVGAQGNTMIRTIFFDDAGDLWVSAFFSGILRLHAATDFETFDFFHTGNTGNTAGNECFLFSPPVDLGLTSPTDFVLGQDANTGNMWFYADDDNPLCFLSSTARFDGVEWYAYNPANSTIPVPNHTQVINTPAGALWLLGPNGPVEVVGETFVPVLDGSGASPGAILEGVRIGPDLWLTTGAGLTRFDGTNFEAQPIDGLVDGHARAVVVDAIPLPSDRADAPARSTWIGTRAGIQRIGEDGTPLESFGVAEGAPDSTINDMFQASDGRLWMTTQGDGTVVFDGAVFTTSSAFGTVPEAAEINPGTGEIWIAVRATGGGLNYSNDGGQTFSLIQPAAANGAPINFVSDIAFAPNGDTWFSTNQGAVRYDGTTWTTFDTSNGLSNNVLSGVDVGADGIVWVAINGGSSSPGVTGHGVGRYDGQTWTRLTPVSDTIDNLNRATEISVDHDGHVWAAILQHGVYRWDGLAWTHFDMASGFVNDIVLRIEVALDGRVWLGTDGGLAIFEAPPPPQCPGDVNADGATDVFDFGVLIAHFGRAVPAGTLGDLDGSGFVNVFDFAILAGSFGCGAN